MHRNLEFWHKTRTFVIVRGGHSPQSQSKPPTMATKIINQQLDLTISAARDAGDAALEQMASTAGDAHTEASKQYLECVAIEKCCEQFKKRIEDAGTEKAINFEARKAEFALRRHLRRPNASTHAAIKAAAEIYKIVEKAGKLYHYTGASKAIAFAAHEKL